MATIDLGKIKQVWRGTYANGTAYTPDDVVEFTDSGILSSYICIANTTGNNPSSSGSAHASWNYLAKGGAAGTDGTSVDVSKLTNDISTLAIRQATQENLVGYNTNSMSVDVFQDSSKITSLTNVARDDAEYISSVYSGVGARFSTPTKYGNATYQTGTKKFGTGALYNANQTDWLQTPSLSGLTGIPTTGNWTIDFWAKYDNRAGTDRIVGIGSGGNSDNSKNHFSMGYSSSSTMNFFENSHNTDYSNYSGYSTNWHHYLIQGNSGDMYHFEDGVYKGTHSNAASGLFAQSGTFIQMGGRSGSGGEKFQGYIDEFRLSNIHRVANSSAGNFTPPTAQYTTDANTMVLMHMDTTDLADSSATVSVNNATGNFQSTGITAPVSTSKVGAIISYTDHAGTNALNSDLVLQLSANGGTNFTTATLTALPNISSTVKMAKVNDLSVTAGTSLKYKILFANQSGSKTARVHGVSLMY